MASDTQPFPVIESRANWQRTDGFLLYTDVNDRMLRSLVEDPIDYRITDEEVKVSMLRDDVNILENPGIAGLYAFTKRASQQVARLGINREEFKNRYGVGFHEGLVAGKNSHEQGFADIDFAWHFGAFLAKTCVDTFVDAGIVTNLQKDRLSFGDWANIIGSGWFSGLVHDLALTGNGLYRELGKATGDFNDGSFERRLKEHSIIKPNDEPLEYHDKLDVQDNHVYATVSASKSCVQGLRRLMKSGDTVGCPVARKSVRLPRADEDNPHIQSMLASGTLQMVDARSDDHAIRLVQDETAIDRALTFFAWQLDQYQVANGTPRISRTRRGAKIRHYFPPQSELLRWPNTEPPL